MTFNQFSECCNVLETVGLNQFEAPIVMEKIASILNIQPEETEEEMRQLLVTFEFLRDMMDKED